MDSNQQRGKKNRKDLKNYYGDDEINEVIQALLETSSIWKLYFLGAIIGGFRRGELIALKEEDRDFDKGWLICYLTRPQTIHCTSYNRYLCTRHKKA
jgi:integrase